MKRHFTIIIIIIIIFSLVLASFISCNEETIYVAEDKFVIQAYLYASEPVWDVSMRKVVPLNVSDSVGEPINDADITLIKDGTAYPLTLNGDSGYYYYQGDDLEITEGDVWQIEAVYDDITASAITQVPNSPEGTLISNNTVELPKIDFIDGVRPDYETLSAFRDAVQNFELTVVWDNPNSELYFVVIESISDNQVSIFPTDGKFAMGRFREVSKPTRESSYEIDIGELTYWGGYVVKVYRVNQEYADLYENLEQDSRDLNEPPTNIENGLGIFSAFNSQNVYFEVKKM